jgi:hypothetical protein
VIELLRAAEASIDAAVYAVGFIQIIFAVARIAMVLSRVVTALGRVFGSMGRALGTLGRAARGRTRTSRGGDVDHSTGGAVDLRFRVKGIDDLNRALEGVSKDIRRAVRKELAEAAQDVADDAKSELGRYPGAKLSSIRPRVGRVGPAAGIQLFVTQHAGTVSGHHPEFGGYIMDALSDAAKRHEAEVARRLDRKIDEIARRHGF